ncbi:MAG: ATP-dependent DNA helicase RecG [Lewinellaceae bacterium]|nr:ATP-dependent DNA helicase RecG [Lewinellaceae bacterium]
MIDILDKPIEYVKGVGPAKAKVLSEELNVKTVSDLLHIFPYRYIDRTEFAHISTSNSEGDLIQLKGRITDVQVLKGKNKRSRLVASFKDASGFMELIWFQSVKVMTEIIKLDEEYIVFGKLSIYNRQKSMIHPEIQLASEVNERFVNTLEPVYSSSEKLEKANLDNRWRRSILKIILKSTSETSIPEILSNDIITKLKLCSRSQALHWIHFPENNLQRDYASNRLKFEEAFFMQLRLLRNKAIRQLKIKGHVFSKVGDYFNEFYTKHLKFELTSAQKSVIKEIRADMGSGIQMNRLLQGDVGSGKTIVALLIMLLSKDNGFQSCMMAPTEILAQQHFEGISDELSQLDLKIAFLSGSVKGKKRKDILAAVASGEVDILIGTHALIEEHVIFKNLGLAIIDEQHRFGVMQRSQLWKKSGSIPPHILVMTATPIPRTLAMTIHGELDVSKIDELPPGRKSIKTIHLYESKRPGLLNFIKEQIKEGRQIYVVYPLIEESEKLELQSLQEGYERLLPYFPPPEYQISIVHGRMKAEDKEFEMQRFVRGQTHIMIATTVIEVGVNVPNASVMIIENAERFGLSQLHQLRGRVGRGASQSFCVMMSSYKLSADGKERLSTMVRTNDGFEIAEADLRLRGPGSIEGTQQSGIPDLKILNLVQDEPILRTARHLASTILEQDPNLEDKKHIPIYNQFKKISRKNKNWGRIS